MLDLQRHFNKFHETIKLNNFEENQNLRDKRDTLINNLKNRITEEAPSFHRFDQGSYAMKTGTNPKDGNYDIDIGIVFNCYDDEYNDPVVLKRYVKDALDFGNRSVRIRKPCVTVEYIKDDKVDYHVDLAIYANRREDDLLSLARGKEQSASENKRWAKSNPKELISKICNAFSDKDERAQMRRCIRYLKRWRDQKLTSGYPVSIALTCAVYNWFEPKYDPFNDKFTDIDALISFTNKIIEFFKENDWLQIILPVEPYEDLNTKMTENQMHTFEQKIEELNEALIQAQQDKLEEEACKTLSKQFGDEFPIPEKKNSAYTATTAGFTNPGESA